MEIQEKIVKVVDDAKDEIVEFIQNLVRIPTVPKEWGGPENWLEIQGFLAKKFDSMNMRINMYEPNWEKLKKHPAYTQTPIGYSGRPNLVATYEGSGTGKSLLLNAHVDTCAPGPGRLWKYDPFGAVIERGRLYGLGSSDTKSGIACVAMAIDCIQRAQLRLKGDVICEMVVDHEGLGGGNGTLSCCIEGYRADAAIVAEAVSSEINIAHTGFASFIVEIEGKPVSHTRKWEGISALDKAWKIYSALSDLEVMWMENAKHEMYPPRAIPMRPWMWNCLPVFVGRFSAGENQIGFPASARLEGGLRFLPGQTLDEAKSQFTDYIARVSSLDPWMSNHLPTIRWAGYCSEPLFTSPKHAFVQAAKSAYKEALGSEPVISGREGAADGARLATYGDMPTILFGPGLVDVMHSANEYVIIDDVIRATKVMALILLEWCGYGD